MFKEGNLVSVAREDNSTWYIGAINNKGILYYGLVNSETGTQKAWYTKDELIFINDGSLEGLSKAYHHCLSNSVSLEWIKKEWEKVLT